MVGLNKVSNQFLFSHRTNLFHSGSLFAFCLFCTNATRLILCVLFFNTNLVTDGQANLLIIFTKRWCKVCKPVIRPKNNQK